MTAAERFVGIVDGAVLGSLALARSEFDRTAERRMDDAWLDRAWRDGATRVLPVADGLVSVVPGHGDTDPRLRWLSSAEAPEGRRYFLGVDGSGTAHFAVGVDDAAALPGSRSLGLRELAPLLDDHEAGAVVHAVALDNWHRTHTHCPRCGAATEPVAAGHIRRCVHDGTEHYPRTDPAVIMAVVDSADRLLLGRGPTWPERRFSTLAGFVEPGESLEQAVAREVWEEVGVRIRSARYLGSQPWPFPSSLMLGFVAVAASTTIDIDGAEIAEARWFSRAELEDAVESGEVIMSPSVSISRRLIEHWFGRPIADTGGAWR